MITMPMISATDDCGGDDDARVRAAAVRAARRRRARPPQPARRGNRTSRIAGPPGPPAPGDPPGWRGRGCPGCAGASGASGRRGREAVHPLRLDRRVRCSSIPLVSLHADPRSVRVGPLGCSHGSDQAQARTKHRGNAVGMIEARGRTGRKPTATEKATKAPKVDRRDLRRRGRARSSAARSRRCCS